MHLALGLPRDKLSSVLGVVHKRQHGFSGGEGQWFCEDSTKALVKKAWRWGEGGGSKIV